MRILVITRELPPVGGGAGHEALGVAEELASRGHEVDVVTMHHGQLPLRERRGGLRIERLRVGRREANSSTVRDMIVFVLRATIRARRLAAQRRYDVAHAHALMPDGLVLLALGLGAGAGGRPPVIVTAHGSDVPGYNPDRYRRLHRALLPLWRRAVRAYDAVTTPSEHLRGMITAVAPQRTVDLLPYGIDPTLVEPAAERLPELLVVSRLIPRKNVHVLLEALASIEEPQTVHVVGEGPELPRLRALAAALPRHDVRFHGWLPHGGTRWRELYERCRFFVFLSSSENFPVSLMEAQLAGMVVLASDIPGNREVLGEHARYVSPVDPASVAAQLAGVLGTEPAHLDEEGARARRRVVDHFSTAASADRFERLFERVAT